MRYMEIDKTVKKHCRILLYMIQTNKHRNCSHLIALWVFYGTSYNIITTISRYISLLVSCLDRNTFICGSVGVCLVRTICNSNLRNNIMKNPLNPFSVFCVVLYFYWIWSQSDFIIYTLFCYRILIWKDSHSY